MRCSTIDPSTAAGTYQPYATRRQFAGFRTSTAVGNPSPTRSGRTSPSGRFVRGDHLMFPICWSLASPPDARECANGALWISPHKRVCGRSVVTRSG
jgi:hypothetical protein